ncbi:hypothetical protein [[Clostridium] aminophilum]|uniref:Uncharacterized protein n=1 Tax=[Clostridium] aminophilum TaxID=1526 RepID=A0A1I6IES3_9FIRM|nr:hypothetical protein [[Clostridium] aminophilum]SFR64850.1 hypothetical protein SAMN02910262_00274 [[Clostridium] aminophilum]
MSKKRLTAGLAMFATCLYIVIIMYVFMMVLRIQNMENFETAIGFEIVGFALLAYFILGNIGSNRIKTGYFVPLLMVTVIYTILLDTINIAFVAKISNVMFVLIHFVVLLVYCIVSIPMYILGKR